MILLSLDPGCTTGFALFDNDTILHVGESDIDHLPSMLSRIPKIDVVVIEDIPIPSARSRLGRDLIRVTAFLSSTFPNAVRIPPGVWKPITGQAQVPIPSTSPHIRDAQRLGLYYLTHRKGK